MGHTIRIHGIERDEVMCLVRHVFKNGAVLDRDTAVKRVCQLLGYSRPGATVRAMIKGDVSTALRRGIIDRQVGQLRLSSDHIHGFTRVSMKEVFCSTLGYSWTDRGAAIRAFARYLGYARTGLNIDSTTRSMITGLLREGRIESDGSRIRRIKKQ